MAAATAAATLGTAAALVGTMASSSSAATVSAPTGKVAVSQGIGPAVLKDASVFGTTPPNTPETVSFILRGRNLSGLEQAVQIGDTPQDSVAQFASQYGQTPALIAALEKYLRGYGISTSSYADNLDVTATGTAGEFDSALSVQQQQYKVPARAAHGDQGGIPAQLVHGTQQDPYLPDAIGNGVLAILGLTNYAPFSDDLTHTPKGVTANNSTTPSVTHTGNLTPADFAKNYNLNPLYSDGITGAGETLAIVTLAGFDPSTATYFWNNVLHITTKPNRITVTNVDGGPGAPNEDAGSGESDLDVEQSGALAPNANIIVYQAPNTDYGFADGFFDAASQNIADTVSSSWGESETILTASVVSGEESPAYQAAFDEVFLEMAAQKQSTFIAAGDSGAYDASGDIGTTNLSVDGPGDSPYVTDAGGTTLGGKITADVGGVDVAATIPAQRDWGWDWLWPEYAAFGFPNEAAFAVTQIAGGGGGFSQLESTPLYQQNISGTHSFSAVEYLTPTDYTSVDGLNLPTEWNFNGSPSVTHGFDVGRATPDVSADADPFTGYLLYDPLSSPALQGGWGGTSFVAPQFNGSTALIDQYVGHRVGLWNPSIYSFVRSGHSPFNVLDTSGTTDDNLYYTGTAGQQFNAGSGLGTPDFAALASDFRH
jgi:subtilase family serine protease